MRRTALSLATKMGLALLLSKSALLTTYGQPDGEDPS
jgi:hypothetical protein